MAVDILLTQGARSLTHWGWVTHICVGKLTIIGSDNGLSPGRRQAIIWTNARLLLIGPLGTNFSEILIAIDTFSFKKMHLKTLSAKWRPSCLGLNVLTDMKLTVSSLWVSLKNVPNFNDYLNQFWRVFFSILTYYQLDLYEKKTTCV